MRRRLAIVALAIGLAACSSSSENSVEPITLPGTYTVQSINGLSLPFTWPDGLVLNSMTVVLNNDGTYVSTPVYAGLTIPADHGTWVVTDGAAVFTDSKSGTVWHGTIDGVLASAVAGG